MTRAKLVLGVALGMVVALLGGWIWGASGRTDLLRQVEAANLRLSLADARSRVVQARVDIYNVNFGEASRNLEAAKTPLQAAVAGLERAGNPELVTTATQVLARVEEAQRQAGALDQGANTTAEAAASALGEIQTRLSQ